MGLTVKKQVKTTQTNQNSLRRNRPQQRRLHPAKLTPINNDINSLEHVNLKTFKIINKVSHEIT